MYSIQIFVQFVMYELILNSYIKSNTLIKITIPLSLLFGNV